MSRALTGVRVVLCSTLAFGIFAFAIAGCGGGEKEVVYAPAGKSKDDLQKDIENPYGAPVKSVGKSKKK
jgi:hypothetical protein